MTHPHQHTEQADNMKACLQRARRQLRQVVTAVVTRAAALSDRVGRRLNRLWNSAIHYMCQQNSHRADTYISRFVDQAVPTPSSDDVDNALLIVESAESADTQQQPSQHK